MAQDAVQHTPKTLDDAARFLIEERGYEKNPALCWKILEEIWAGRITLRRHWKKYDLNGNPQQDGAEVLNRSVFRGRNLDFDPHGHIKFVPGWGGEHYTIVEPCYFWIIWPPRPTAPEQQPDLRGMPADQSHLYPPTPSYEQLQVTSPQETKSITPAKKKPKDKKPNSSETRLVGIMKGIGLAKSGLQPREVRKAVKQPYKDKYHDEPSDSAIARAYKTYQSAD